MRTVDWVDGAVRMIDQTKLPLELAVIECRTPAEVAEAIVGMRVRGAPAIGVAAALGVALGALTSEAVTHSDLMAHLAEVTALLRSTRPTAVNLFWALDLMNRAAAEAGQDVETVKQALVRRALELADEDEQRNRRMGGYGAELLDDGDTVLTHCNAGALATVDFGTALGVIKAAHLRGKKIRVYADETRPLLQGARLSAWELVREGIPTTLITDNMAGHFMSRGVIDKVLVGADRIAANGDVANKIGTYSVAVLAKENGIPFFVAAPTSTIDLTLASGDAIPIEERNPEEVLCINGRRIAPEGVEVANPAFDVTPQRYVSAIITERGIIRSPFEKGLSEAVESSFGERTRLK